MSDWLKETSLVLASGNVDHVTVEAFPNPGLYDGAIAEELMVLASGIKSHVTKCLSKLHVDSKERAKINGVLARVDELLATLKPMRYRANLQQEDIQDVLDDLTLVVRSLREHKSIIGNDVHDAAMKLILRSRDALMSYGVRSRQPSGATK